MMTGPFSSRARFLDEACLLARFIPDDHFSALGSGIAFVQRKPFSLQVGHRMAVPADRSGLGHVARPRCPAEVSSKSRFVEGRDKNPFLKGVPLVAPSLDAIEVVKNGGKGVVGALVNRPSQNRACSALGVENRTSTGPPNATSTSALYSQ